MSAVVGAFTGAFDGSRTGYGATMGEMVGAFTGALDGTLTGVGARMSEAVGAFTGGGIGAGAATGPLPLRTTEKVLLKVGPKLPVALTPEYAVALMT